MTKSQRKTLFVPPGLDGWTSYRILIPVKNAVQDCQVVVTQAGDIVHSRLADTGEFIVEMNSRIGIYPFKIQLWSTDGKILDQAELIVSVLADQDSELEEILRKLDDLSFNLLKPTNSATPSNEVGYVGIWIEIQQKFPESGIPVLLSIFDKRSESPDSFSIWKVLYLLQKAVRTRFGKDRNDEILARVKLSLGSSNEVIQAYSLGVVKECWLSAESKVDLLLEALDSITDSANVGYALGILVSCSSREKRPAIVKKMLSILELNSSSSVRERILMALDAFGDRAVAPALKYLLPFTDSGSAILFFRLLAKWKYSDALPEMRDYIERNPYAGNVFLQNLSLSYFDLAGQQAVTFLTNIWRGAAPGSQAYLLNCLPFRSMNEPVFRENVTQTAREATDKNLIQAAEVWLKTNKVGG